MQAFKLYILFWIVIALFSQCKNLRICPLSGLERLDTTCFVSFLAKELSPKVGVSDTSMVIIENCFYNNINPFLYEVQDDINSENSNTFRRLTSARSRYEHKYSNKEKIPMPAIEGYQMVRRSGFMRISEDLKKDPFFITFSLPYYVGNKQWCVWVTYSDQYLHGYSYCLLVSEKKSGYNIVWFFCSSVG